MITTVTIGTNAAAVSGVQLQTCVSGAFGAAVWSDPGGWPVGIGNGVQGAAVVETYLPLAQLNGAGPVRVAVISTDGQVSDALIGGANGQPLVIDLNPNSAGDPAAIPVLNPLMLALLAALLGGALRYGRCWPGATRLLVLVVVMAGAGLAWAAFVRDGQTNDWTGVAPLATQQSAVTGPAKIVALFAKAEGGNLNFRIDAGIGFTTGNETTSSIEFTSDQSLLFSAPGQRRTLKVQVIGPDGAAIPNAQVTWSSAIPATVAVTPTGPLSAEVVAQAVWSDPIAITADYAPLGISGDAQAIMGTPAPQTVLASSDVVISIDGDRGAQHQITLSRTAETERLQPGQILVTGDLAGVLVHVLQVALRPDRVILLAEPVAINEAFKDLNLSVEGKPVEITFEAAPSGAVTVEVRTSGSRRLLKRQVLSQFSLIDNLKCDRSIKLGGEFTLSTLNFKYKLIPRFNLKPQNYQIVDFLLMLEGGIDADIGFSMDLSGGVKLAGECKVTLPEIKLPRLPIGPFSVRPILMPELGLNIEANAEASTKLLQKNFSYSCSGKAGIRYTSQDWQWIGESQCKDLLEIKNPFIPDSALKFTAGPFIDAVLKIEFNAGYKPVGLELASFNLLDFITKADDQFAIELPLYSAQKSYKGPEEKYSVLAKASVDIRAYVFENLFKIYIPLPKNIDLKFELYSKEYILYQTAKPTGNVTCDPICSAVPADGSGSITLLAQADTTDTGQVEFWASINNNPSLIKLTEASFFGGRGQAVYKPVGATIGDIYTIYPRLKLDNEMFGLTKTLPLASEDAEKIGAFTVSDTNIIDDDFLSHFPDPVLRACVAQYKGQLVSSVNYLSCSGGVQDLSGTELLTQLQTLILYGNRIVDISPLRGLIQLQQLDLGDNQLSDLGLLNNNLTQLRKLRLSDNQIVDVSPLSGWTQLQDLDLSYNRIVDVSPLSSLTQLQRLVLYSNRIVDVRPLRSLTQLDILDLRLNQMPCSNVAELIPALKPSITLQYGFCACTCSNGNIVGWCSNNSISYCVTTYCTSIQSSQCR